MPSLDEICPVVLEKIFKFHQCNFIILLISSLKKDMALHSIKHEIPLTQGCFFSSLVEIGTVIQEETIFKFHQCIFPFLFLSALGKNHMALNKFIWTILNPIYPTMLCDFQNVAEETCIITKFLSTNYLNFACLFLKGKKFIAPTSQKKKKGNFTGWTNYR